MYVEQRTGSIPGVVFATIHHGPTVRTLSIEVARTSSDHYIAKLPNGRWSQECMTPESAILMHAAIVFPVEIQNAPWLNNMKPVILDTTIKPALEKIS